MIEGTPIKPSQQKAVLDKYIKKFAKWALALSIEDKLQLAVFMRSVQQAHAVGQAEPEPLDETPHQGEPKLILPGLGGDGSGSFVAHQPSPAGGLDYRGLNDLMPKGRKPS